MSPVYEFFKSALDLSTISAQMKDEHRRAVSNIYNTALTMAE